MPTTLSDGKKSIKLPLNPESIKMSIAGEYAVNSVLDTANPQVRRKSSAKTYKLGRILLASASGTTDYQPVITTLQYWAAQQTRLKYDGDTYHAKVCYIKSLDLDVKLWKGAKVLLAEIDIDLIEADPTASSKPEAAKTKKKLTPAEQARTKTALEKKLKSPVKQKLLSLADNYSVTVDDLAMVTLSSDGVDNQYELEDLEGKLA
jgi:hypothetical protein